MPATSISSFQLPEGTKNRDGSGYEKSFGMRNLSELNPNGKVVFGEEI